jgi:hypothetical protein
MRYLYPKEIWFIILKPLYGLAESGLYWYATYLNYYRYKLGIETSIFNLYLLIIKKDKYSIGFTGLQTDNTLNLGT